MAEKISVDYPLTFTKDEVNRLKTILNSLSKPSGSCSLPTNGLSVCSQSFSVCGKISKNAWILDSGATDHMTFNPSLISSYTSSEKNCYVTAANGSYARIDGSGSVNLQPPLQLQDVLHVPTLSHNLIFVRKLTRDHDCKVIFFTSYCVFQDLTTGKTIGVAKEKGGLYYLSDEPNCSKVLASYLQTESSVSSHSAAQIWLQHKRLGHPPFSLVKSMFPSLFLHHSVESFKCDVCELAKHHRVSFTPSSKRSVEPFDLIHSDVWGPAPISNISGAK